MIEYYLFALAFAWTIFATVQDLRYREVANWLTFSLIACGLAARAFYSVYVNDYHSFLFGVIGFAIFFVLGYVFYYSKAFAGGDAKLLMGVGVILPYMKFSDLLTLPLFFVLLLFSVGAVYSLGYSIFLVASRFSKFSREFAKKVRKTSKWYVIAFFVFLVAIIFIFGRLGWLTAGSSIFFVFLYYYLYSLDRCMIVEIIPSKLSEGDWLERDVKVGGKWIRKSVHGLSLEEIVWLKKNRKSVFVKEGIPFVPAFLFALVIMVLVWSGGTSVLGLLASLFVLVV